MSTPVAMLAAPTLVGCNAFTEGYPVSSLRGFNQQIVSNFTWDSATAQRLTLDGWVPVADNDKTTVTSSQILREDRLLVGTRRV